MSRSKRSKPILPFLAELLAATAASYVASQALKSYMSGKAFLETFDIPAFTDYILFSLFKVPTSTAWNAFLDDLFAEERPALPALKPEKSGSGKNEGPQPTKATKISWRVVLYKLVLNQAIYSVFLNATIIAFMSFRRRGREGTASWDAVYGDVKRSFLPLYLNALKLWPAVNVVAFAFFDTLPRMRFLTAVSLFWSVYVILMVTER